MILHNQLLIVVSKINLLLALISTLTMYVMDKPGKWEYYLHLVYFSYNNHFQVSTGMSTLQILYEHKSNTPISWSSLVDTLMLGPQLLKYMELTMKHVQQNLKAP